MGPLRLSGLESWPLPCQSPHTGAGSVSRCRCTCQVAPGVPLQSPTSSTWPDDDTQPCVDRLLPITDTHRTVSGGGRHHTPPLAA